MFRVIKNKGKIVKAYKLGSDNVVLNELIACGRILDLGGGSYEVFSRETKNGAAGGELAKNGDWIKVDGEGYPYPNNKEFFEANHRHIEGNTFEQIPKPLLAWDDKFEMCQEIMFLIENKGLKIDESSFEKHYTAELWGTQEVAAGDAVIVFYSIEYDKNGLVKDADFNFVAREEFDRIYSIVDDLSFSKE